MTALETSPASTTGIPWRASVLAAVAAVLIFGALLMLASVSCLSFVADCNTTALLVLPVAAVMFGLPAMMLFSLVVLVPASRWLVRRGTPVLAPLMMLGAVPGIVLAGVALAREWPVGLGHSLAIIAYVGIGLGLPGATGGLVVGRLLSQETLNK